ncbi:MAG: hypothetical protein KDM91_23215, partial [Verrucomicrobiae bacterium]|nr:hypothetical protein [Verrucomicrobiae bacterium]
LSTALNRLRKWKIIGASDEMDNFDAHPVLRRALKEYDPDGDASVREEADRLLALWSTEDQTFRDAAGKSGGETSTSDPESPTPLSGGEVPMEILKARWQTVLGFANTGASAIAFEMFDCAIESHLRYRTRSAGLTAAREKWLLEAIGIIDQFALLKESDSLSIFRGLLSSLLADNHILAGNINAALDCLPTALPPKSAAPEGTSSDANRDGESPALWLMQARTERMRTHCRWCQGARGETFDGLQSVIEGAIKVLKSKNAPASLWNSAVRIVEWSSFDLAILASEMGLDDYASTIEKRFFKPPGKDADADYARLAMAKLKGENLADRLGDFRRSCNESGNRLNYGNVVCHVQAAELWVRHRVVGEGTLQQLLDLAEDEAFSQGFTKSQREIELLRLEESVPRRPAIAESRALQIADEAHRMGNWLFEAEARLVAVAAVLAGSDADVQRAGGQAETAFRLAWGDGTPWVNGTLQHRAVLACEATGIDWRQIEEEMIRAGVARRQWDESELKKSAEATKNASQTTGTVESGASTPENITNPAGWTTDEIRAEVENIKLRFLGWEETTGSARKWWKTFEQENEHRYPLILRLVEELRNRGATISSFFLAYVYSNTDNIQANLHYLDYTNLKKAVESSDTPAEKAWNFQLLVDWKSDLDDLNDAALSRRLSLLEGKIGLPNTAGSALKWWESLKKDHSDDLRDLARTTLWMSEGGHTISELFLAFVYSNTDNLQAILHYMMYSRLKKQEGENKRAREEEERKLKAAQDEERARKMLEDLRSGSGDLPDLWSLAEIEWLADNLPASLVAGDLESIQAQLSRLKAEHFPEPEPAPQELTFIRCRQCRSLVPAVSTRCRMCGASLTEDS